MNGSHVVDVLGIEKLRPKDRKRELGSQGDDLIDALRRVGCPVRPGDGVASPVVTSGATAQISEVVGVKGTSA